MPPFLHRIRSFLSRFALSLVVAFALAACGGGGGGDDDDEPTTLPASLTLTVPASALALAAPVTFGSNAVDPAASLTYRWEFGDGATATVAQPVHTYARSGRYDVRLTVTNEAGETRTAMTTVRVSDVALVQGLGCSAGAGTGWCWQRPLPQGNPIRAHAMVDDTHGFAVGDTGTALATDDGGLTWRVLATGTPSDLLHVSFVNAQAGYAAAGNGEVLRTTDGGATWQRSSIGVAEQPAQLRAFDALQASLVTQAQTLHVTRDGGTTWTRVELPAYATQVTPVGASDVWVVTPDYSPAPGLQRSRDGGATWQAVALPPIDDGLSSYGMSTAFRDALHGVVSRFEQGWDPVTGAYVYRERIWRTADGGASWVAIVPPASLVSGSMHLVSDTTLVARLWSYGVSISTDDGATWTPLRMPDGIYGIDRVDAASPNRLIVYGWSGTARAHLTVDGGATWRPLTMGADTYQAVKNLWFFDSREGMALLASGSFLRTTDGGRTWAGQAPNGYYAWEKLQFTGDGSTGWVLLNGATIARSTDRGRTWSAPVISAGGLEGSPSDFQFLDSTVGFAVVPYRVGGYGSALFRSQDGAASWTAVAAAGLGQDVRAIRFSDAQRGIAVGPPGVAYRTVDGGATWQAAPTGSPYRLLKVALLDAETVVAVGEQGVLVRSSDFGRTWSVVSSRLADTLRDVRFVPGGIGMAVGDYGAILRTEDGGLTWNRQSSGTRLDLYLAFMLDSETAWAAGSGEAILVTANGGR